MICWRSIFELWVPSNKLLQPLFLSQSLAYYQLTYRHSYRQLPRVASHLQKRTDLAAYFPR
jgi:hypothetical protein